MNEKVINIESGIPHQILRDYFDSIAIRKRGNDYFGAEWELKIISMHWVCIGSLKLPRTNLEFKGEAVTITNLVEEFRLRFLSAGG